MIDEGASNFSLSASVTKLGIDEKKNLQELPLLHSIRYAKSSSQPLDDFFLYFEIPNYLEILDLKCSLYFLYRLAFDEKTWNFYHSL